MNHLSDRSALELAEQLFADAAHYAALGDHRTASPSDHATSHWICDTLNTVGVSARLDPWPLRQFQLEDSWLEVYGQRLEGFPLWHPRAAGEQPLCGALENAADDVTGKIALAIFKDVMVTPKSDHAALIEDLARRGARAIIACTPHFSGEIYGQNVIPPANQTPWPIPVLMVAPKHWHVLQHAAVQKVDVRFCLSGQDDETAQASNVVGKLERGERWVIVSTPQSGWFRCAGERGAGVALLLQLARWASAANLSRSFLFLSNSGHEIGHMGIHHLFEQDLLPSPKKTDLWLHLGSSIGTYGYADDELPLVPNGPDKDSCLYASEDLIALLKDTFAPLSHLNPKVYDRKNGEIRWILERGYPGVALMGPQRFFHLKDDGPEVVDPQLMAMTTRVLMQTILTLDHQNTD